MKKTIFLFLILFISILSIEAGSGSITIKRYDENNNKISNDLLVGTKVKLFKSNRLIMTLSFDENGEIFVDNLDYGEYKVEEEKAPIGYNLDRTEYTIYLSESKDHLVNIKSKKIEGNLIINKYYGDSSNYKLDDNAVFEIYKNNNLLKTLTPTDGTINEKLEYGTYLIKQVSGQKYYDLSDEFTISINKEQDYIYDLYTDMEVELKEFFYKKEEDLNDREQQLIKIENELNVERNSLINLKNELLQKELELNNEKENLITKEKNLEKLKEEISFKYEELNIKKDQIITQENELNKLKEEFELSKIELNIREENLTELELNINKTEEELNRLKEELYLLSNKLLEKENGLIDMENDIKNKQLELNKREKELTELKNKIKNQKEVLVVEVPNTYKKNYNKLISIILIIIGSVFIICSKRKVTSH